MPMHTVAQGECVMSIASRAGFTWETVWNDGRNSALKNKRKRKNGQQEEPRTGWSHPPSQPPPAS